MSLDMTGPRRLVLGASPLVPPPRIMRLSCGVLLSCVLETSPLDPDPIFILPVIMLFDYTS